MKEVMDVDAVI